MQYRLPDKKGTRHHCSKWICKRLCQPSQSSINASAPESKAAWELIRNNEPIPLEGLNNPSQSSSRILIRPSNRGYIHHRTISTLDQVGRRKVLCLHLPGVLVLP